jgi:hypothetical protein
MSSASDLIHGEIAALRSQAERERAVLQERQSKLSAIDQTIASLQAVLGKLNGVMAGKVTTDAQRTPLLAGARRKPADAIREFLREHESGLPAKEIVTQLEGRIESNAADKKRLLYTTLFTLKKRGELEMATGKDGDQVVRLTKHSVA